MQPAGADAVFAVLVFLNLLESHAERLAELGLAHLAPLTQKPNARTNQHIDRIGPFGPHAALCVNDAQ